MYHAGDGAQQKEMTGELRSPVGLIDDYLGVETTKPDD
jgi:hypothetical protein